MRRRSIRRARSLKLAHLVVATVPALIVVLSVTGFMWAQKDVTVVVDGQEHRVATQARDVAAVLEHAGISVSRGDLVTPGRTSAVDHGDTVIVRRCVPVTVDLGGEPIQVDVVGDTVADALVAAGVDISASPAVAPSLDEQLEPGMVIAAPEVFVRVTQEETTLTAKVETLEDPTLPVGKRKVVSEGEPGKLLRVSRVTVTQGVEGEPDLTTEMVVDKPKPRVVAVGTGAFDESGNPVAGPVPPPPAGGRTMRVESTAYSPREPGLDFTTATGARAEKGVVAVDPRVIPLGTKVYVPGYGYAVARDTGGAIKGRRIDVCFETVAEANRWGRRHVTVVILD